MEQELQSFGKCLFCEQKLKQAEIGKHLTTHLAEIEVKEKAKVKKNYHHIVIEAGEMFLHILVDGNAKMKALDNFLRKIWLECCGHLSNFGHKNYKISLSNTVSDIFMPKVKIYHNYDYGSTTRIELKSVKTYLIPLKESLILLSRNEPLKLMCGTCKKQPAVSLCSVCIQDQFAFFCENCAEKHQEVCSDFENYANMPVVNSPRMGVCGYEGGTIDKGRDGAYKK
jgi:hypothetical protein